MCLYIYKFIVFNGTRNRPPLAHLNRLHNYNMQLHLKEYPISHGITINQKMKTSDNYHISKWKHTPKQKLCIRTFLR